MNATAFANMTFREDLNLTVIERDFIADLSVKLINTNANTSCLDENNAGYVDDSLIIDLCENAATESAIDYIQMNLTTDIVNTPNSPLTAKEDIVSLEVIRISSVCVCVCQ